MRDFISKLCIIMLICYLFINITFKIERGFGSLRNY